MGHDEGRQVARQVVRQVVRQVGHHVEHQGGGTYHLHGVVDHEILVGFQEGNLGVADGTCQVEGEGSLGGPEIWIAAFSTSVLVAAVVCISELRFVASEQALI